MAHHLVLNDGGGSIDSAGSARDHVASQPQHFVCSVLGPLLRCLTLCFAGSLLRPAVIGWHVPSEVASVFRSLIPFPRYATVRRAIRTRVRVTPRCDVG